MLDFSHISDFVEEQENRYQKRINNEVDLKELNSSLGSPFVNEHSATADALLVNIFSFLIDQSVLSSGNSAQEECDDINTNNNNNNKKQQQKKKQKKQSKLQMEPLVLVCKRWHTLWTSCVEFINWLAKYLKKNRTEFERRSAVTSSLFELPEAFYRLPVDRYKMTVDEKIPLITLYLVFPRIKFTIWRSTLNSCVFAQRYADGTLENDEEEFKDIDELDPEDETEEEMPISSVAEIPKTGNFHAFYQTARKHGIIMMITHGGYYAGGRYVISPKHQNGIEEKEHKTFHKYVTRKKQGKRQVSQDKSKRAKSVGSEMRRLNEKHFREELQTHLLQWSDLFASGETIVYLHAPGHYNRSLMFKFTDASPTNGLSAEQSPVIKTSCHTIPFSTGSSPNNTQLNAAVQKILQIQIEPL